MLRVIRHLLFVAAVIGVLLLGTDAADPMCRSMGRTSAIVVGQSISTCKEFYPTGTAIRAPKDTATMKYGMIGSYPSQASFIDRTGMTWLVSQDIMPNLTDPSSKTINQLVVQASLSNGTVMAITVMLFIPTDTMVKPFRNTAFIGTITNWGPPYNVNATNWVRWDMGNSIKPRDTFLTLEGQVTNLFASVRDAKGRCQSALCTLTSPNSPRCQWYKEFLGNGKAMSLYWDPAMHAPMDSELVPWFASGISYMYGVPRPNELLATNVKLGQQWSFTIHGTPIGTLYQFNGKFSKAPAPCYCS